MKKYQTPKFLFIWLPNADVLLGSGEDGIELGQSDIF